MKTPDNFAVENVLVERKYITQEDVDEARKAAPQGKIVEYLLAQNKITRDLLGQALSEYFQLTYFDLNSANIPQENLNALSPNVAQELRIVIVNASADSVTLATDKPVNLDKIKLEMARVLPRKEVVLYYSLTEDLDELFKVYTDALQQRLDSVMTSNNVNFAELLFRELMLEATNQHATVIHLEPQPDKVVIRFRVDGILKELGEIPTDFYENILNRVKVLAGIKLDKLLSIQDGAFRYLANEKQIDIKVSIIPLGAGQKVVLKILGDYNNKLTLEYLGLNAQHLELLQTAAAKTSGMILATGPNGSGKTTTLYALIKSLQKPEVNITTIEDPIEYRIPGVNQIQINKEQNVTFPKALLSVGEQDANVILVGELADRETIELAFDSALCGNLILAALPGNDAAGSITRLLNWGIDPFLLAATLNLLISQRLVRKICESCRYSVTYTDADLKALVPNRSDYRQLQGSGSVTLYGAKGCYHCNYTGFSGRTGIYELIDVNKDIRNLILARADSKEIWELAQKQGAVSFFENGLEKVVLGQLTLEELVRVAPTQINEKPLNAKKKVK